jgi:nicotinate-nucleotide adenylyltransferase
VAPLRLGLFGGTFDPPHLGHLVVAQDVLERLDLDRVVFVVAGLPPHKLGEGLSPAHVRLEMVRAAVRGNRAFEASGVEVNQEGPSYTVDTLRRFRAMHPEAHLFFLMGADQLAEFHEWREPETVAALATVVAMTREGSGGEWGSSDHEPIYGGRGSAAGGGKPVSVRQEPPAGAEPAAGPSAEFVRLPVTRLDLSSTDVRERVREGRSIQYLVPPDVLGIIEDQGLYRSIS